MKGWPPSVLLAVRQNTMRQILRGFLRSCGVRELEQRSSCQEALADIQASARRWDILIFDMDHSCAPKALASAKNGDSGLRILIVLCSPTKQEVLAAKQAGADEIMIYPLSQTMLENKLRKLSGEAAVLGAH